MRRPVGPIGHCSEKLRKAIEINDEEALLGTVRIRRRPKTEDEDDAKKLKGGGRFSVEPDFRVLGPFSSRPLSPLGHVSFHFSRDTVTKVSNNASLVSTASGTKRVTGAAPADHDGYIARPGAVMAISAAEFDGYAVRGKAVEDLENGQGAILSNISPNPQVRRDFWLKVHKHERTPEPDALEFRRDRLSTADWIRISTLGSVPADVRKLAAQMAALCDSSKGNSKKSDAVLQMDRVKAGKATKAIRDELGHWNGKKPPLRLRKGRGGRTQFRLTAEFAEGLDGAARLRIATAFCDRLGEIGVMYTAAIHEPDEHNNERNFHLHVAYYDRPAQIMPGTDLWDFEIREKVPDQHERYRYPHRQPKIGKLVRDPEGGNFREYAADQIYGLRELFAQLSNEELKRAGSTRLFDPRTYKEMGIEQKPTRPLGPKAASLQAVGVPTVIGTDNAEILGTAALQRVRRECAREAKERAALRNEVASTLTDPTSNGGTSRDTVLRTAFAGFEQAAAVLDAHDLESREYDIWLQIIEAGPAKTIDTCSRILGAIEAGEATRSDQKQKSRIEARKKAAEAYLADVRSIHESNKAVLLEVRKELQDARENLAVAALELATLLESEVSQVTSSLVREKDPTACSGVAKDEERSCLDGAHPLEALLVCEDDGELAQVTEPDTPAENGIRGQLDEIFQRILAKDQPITLPDNQDARYRVQGISKAEFQLLSNPTVHAWVQARLEGIAEIQQKKMENAARLLARLGEDGLCRMAEQHFLFQQAKDHAEAYRAHPTFQAKLEANLKKQGKSVTANAGIQRADKRPKSDKGASAQVAAGRPEKPGFLSRCFRPTGEPAISVPSATETPSWTPARPVREPTNNERQEAILAFADAIRTSSKVRLIERDGRAQIDPESLPEWLASLNAFADEGVVRKAVGDRWAEKIEREKAFVRQLTIATVQTANTQPSRQTAPTHHKPSLQAQPAMMQATPSAPAATIEEQAYYLAQRSMGRG